MGDDGRLSAAELDTVLGSAAAPTGPGRRPEPDLAAPSGKADVLDRGPVRPTWAESAQMWARGHRLTAAVVVLLAGAGTLGGWAYLASRPPPLLTTIDAAVLIDTIDPLPVRGSGAAILVRTNLVLHAADPGDDLRAVALHGAGLAQPQVRQSGTQVAASNMLDCNAIADLTVPATFALTVERSDPWGRVVTRDITVTGLGAEDAGTQIVRACLTRAADALQLRVVSYDGAAAAPLRLEIRNPTAVDLVHLRRGSRARRGRRVPAPAGRRAGLAARRCGEHGVPRPRHLRLLRPDELLRARLAPAPAGPGPGS